MSKGEISLAATDRKMTFHAIISKTSNTGCVWSFQRIAIVHIDSNIPLIVCHLFDVGKYYIIPDIRNPSTLLLSGKIMYRYVLWQMWRNTAAQNGARGGGGILF